MASLDRGSRLADRFELQDRLGDGGHAEVWSARDLASGGQVALKFLHLRNCSTEEALQVLRHEAAMARRLEHPGVLRADEPVRDGALVFLPLEHAPGGDASRLRGAPWQRLVPVLLDVARVLEHAHSRGVVHRDIKPGNVLFDAHGAVRLTDFGTAARTGCSDGFAAGSPFSASPQQLRGKPATTADDVYGLGALAYELLGGYPPWYPEFDAERVQREDPPPPQPAHPTPAPLLALVRTMLARVSRKRPDLAEVMQVLESLQAQAAGPASTADVTRIVAAQDESATPPAARRGLSWRRVAAWSAAMAVAALGAWTLLAESPGAGQPARLAGARPTAAPLQPPQEPKAVAEAVVARAADGPAAPVAAPVRDIPAQVTAAVAEGESALSAAQPALARAAFQRALLLDPGAARARAGMTAAAALDRAVALLAEGVRAEAQGRNDAARTAYRDALAARGAFAPARAGLERVEARLRDERFEALLADGAAALREGRAAAALQAYRQAAALQPQEPRVQDGQARVAEVLRSERNAQDLAGGAGLEHAERWDEALAHYQAVLARDASLRFAQDGEARAQRRLALDRELADYLARPARLTAPAVRAAAERAVARGAASMDGAPRLAAQLQQLQARLQALAEPVRVALTSDDTTQVTVATVGDLGAFRERELALRPGHYTVIGRRDGYRDVRLELEIQPGQSGAVLAVQCTERI